MENYYIGLDVGTDSIGWAVTNEQYQIPKFKGNAMWGIRLLEESDTAQERRLFRTARRRTQRRRFRLDCLEMLFDKEISKVDQAFFQRLKESNLCQEDKSVTGRYSVFCDSAYTDKSYHRQYPTIYHLRSELLKSNEPHDIRLVYLAVSHLVKNRGHFLFDSEFSTGQERIDFKTAWNELSLYCRDNAGFDLDLDETSELEVILKDQTLTKTRKKQKVFQLFNVSKKEERAKSALLTLITGGTAAAADLFDDDDYKTTDCKNICISSSFDDNAPIYEAAFGEKYELIEKIKAVFDWITLSTILKGEPYLSFAKVRDYEKHRRDLEQLKKYVRTYCNDKYNLIFNKNQKGICNYSAYSAHTKPSPNETNCNQEKFCEFLKKQLPAQPADGKYEEMYEEIAAGSFMPKQVTKDNSVIPQQINRAELEQILNNAEKYLPFLTQADETGKTVSEKILDVFSYRIPYYVGPLNKHSDKHWLVRSDEKIYPWNWKSVVDLDKSAENFIQNLTSKCTYLPREDVIPQNSLLYSAYMVLNDLNNVKLDGEKLPVALKQEIYLQLFARKNKVTQKALSDFLKVRGYGEPVISGIDGDFKSSLKPFRDLAFLDLPQTDKEEIIRAITIFGDDKKMLRHRLRIMYGSRLSPEDIRTVCRLKYAGWGRFSKKFLAGLEGVITETGEISTVIHALWETQNNLMQLLSNQNTFVKSIQEENGDVHFTTLREEVDALYVSPKVKRPIYQTMQIVDELVKIKKEEPAKIFVEMPRGPEEKKRTKSRKQRLNELYIACKKQQPELYKQLQTYDENDLRRDALYLYFTQFGKCMYTGKPLDIEDITNKNICDIDHIYPQSKIKDDSLDNRVLVLKTANEAKGNIYPIKADIRSRMQSFWQLLMEKELISKKKYERLMRNTALSDEELSEFIARQLVETRQSTKAIAELLKKRYPKTEIVYVKARLASEFRQQYDMLKCREVNDLHHAKDAYLNIVVGNVYNTQFNHNRAVYIKGLQNGTYSMRRMFDYPVKGAWQINENSSIAIVKKTMLKNNIRFTRYSYQQAGGLFDQNLLKKGNGQVSIKKDSPRADIEKYGGYNRPASTFFAIARYQDAKNKTITQIVPVDLHEKNEYLQNPAGYLCKKLKVENATVVVPCLKYNTLISINGFRMHISSKSSGGAAYVCKPAVQLVLGYESEKYIKAITNYLTKCKEQGKAKEITPWDHITAEENTTLYNQVTEKLQKSIFNVKFDQLGKTLAEKQEKFTSLSLYEQCIVLQQILEILHANVRTGDLTLIGQGSKTGAMTIGCKIAKTKDVNSFKIIHQSVTGLFEQETELLTQA